MNVPPVGNPSPHPATPSAKTQELADPPQEQPPSTQAPPHAEEATPNAGRTKAELERLADEIVAIFEESPEQLEALVATLKRLEGSTS